MASALMPEEQKESGNNCDSLALNIADWMVPETISGRNDSSCNVLVIVPYGYPGEDDNVELLGGLLAEELDCYAVINNREYHRKSSKQPLGKKGDLGRLSFFDQTPEFKDPIEEALLSLTKTVNPAIVIFLHAMEDRLADEFQDGLVLYGTNTVAYSRMFLDWLKRPVGLG